MGVNHERRYRLWARSRSGRGLTGVVLPAPSVGLCEAASTTHLTDGGLVLLFYSRRGGQLS